jgi:hypothetical protein
MGHLCGVNGASCSSGSNWDDPLRYAMSATCFLRTIKHSDQTGWTDVGGDIIDMSTPRHWVEEPNNRTIQTFVCLKVRYVCKIFRISRICKKYAEYVRSMHAICKKYPMNRLNHRFKLCVKICGFNDFIDYFIIVVIRLNCFN